VTFDLELSVIIPAYNEAARLPRTLRRAHEYLSQSGVRYEIIVVLDGPTDDTSEIARAMQGEIAHLKILERAVNRGKGYTVKEGMLKAAGKVRLFTDADNSTDIAYYAAMKPLFESGSDVVIASRSSRDASGAEQLVAQRWHKRLAGQAGNLWVQMLATPGIWDTQCGFKAFRAGAAERIFSQTTIDGWGFDIEALALARALGYKVGVIPVGWVNDPRTHMKPGDYLRVLAETLKVRFNLTTRRYEL
jgi:glycosyltransferase involved in cell wall biosynthesis